jgi:hypothetical protein
MEITITITVDDEESQGYGMAHQRADSGPVWLVADLEDMTPEQYEAAMGMSRDECHALLDSVLAGEPLPECFYVMDKSAAHRALAYGIQRWGAHAFFNRCDYGDYDCAVQYALLGDVLYG